MSSFFYVKTYNEVLNVYSFETPKYSFIKVLKEASSSPLISDWVELIELVQTQESFGIKRDEVFVPLSKKDWKILQELSNTLRGFSYKGLDQWAEHNVKTNLAELENRKLIKTVQFLVRQIVYIKRQNTVIDCSAIMHTSWHISNVILKLSPNFNGYFTSKRCHNLLLSMTHSFHINQKLLQEEISTIKSQIKQSETFLVKLLDLLQSNSQYVVKSYEIRESHFPVFFFLTNLYSGNSIDEYKKFVSREDILDWDSNQMYSEIMSLPFFAQIGTPNIMAIKRKMVQTKVESSLALCQIDDTFESDFNIKVYSKEPVRLCQGGGEYNSSYFPKKDVPVKLREL